MTWKKVNISDTGTGSKFGANDMDKLSDAFSGVDVDDFDINCDFKVRDDKFHLADSDNSHYYNFSTGNLSANRNLNYPVLTADDEPLFKSFAATVVNKTVDIRDNPLITRENSYFIFKDGSTYYARNGITGALTSNSDFKTLLQAIVDTIPTRDDTVFTKIKLGIGNFDVESLVTIADKYNIVFEGSGMGITNIRAGSSLGTNSIIRVNGSVSGTGKNLTANGIIKAKSVSMSSPDAATFAAGDTVLLRANNNFSSSGSASGHCGELKIVKSVSGTTVTFTTPLFDDYTTANTANVIKILPCKKISFSNLSIIPHPSYVPGGSVYTWFGFNFCDRVLVQNVEIRDYPGQFTGYLAFASSTNVRVDSCHLHQTIAYNFQYGFTFSRACQDCVVSNCTADGPMRHHYEAGNGEDSANQEGVCRNILFTGCTASGGEQNPFDTHPEGEGISFVNCGILGTDAVGGFKLRSQASSVIDCKAVGIDATGGSGSQSVIQIDDFADNCIISGNHIYNCNGTAIKVGVNGACEGAIISNNIINGVTESGIDLRSGSSKAIITGNTIRSCSQDGVKCVNIDDSIFSNNRIAGNTLFGLRFEAGTCTNNIVHGNWFGTNGSGNVSNGGQSGNVEGHNKGYP